MVNYSRKLFIAFVLLTVTIYFLPGCEKNDKAADPAEDVMLVEKADKRYNINSQDEIRALIQVLARERGEIEILEATVADFKDRQGSFKALAAKYKHGNELTKLVVPLAVHQSAKGGTTILYTVEDCEMKCTSAWGCTECTQTIIERCKSQTCTCTSGNGGCSSKIIFPPSES